MRFRAGKRQSLIWGMAIAALVPVACGGDDNANEREPGNKKGSEDSDLFVQNARSGTFTPKPGKPGSFTLSLRGVDPHALFFTDRPARDTGVMPQQAMVDALFRRGQPPPNAVVELVGTEKNRDALGLTLSRPRYDRARGTITYDARALKDLTKDLRHYDDRLDRKLPAKFNRASLFIDDSAGNSCAVNVANDTGDWISIQSHDNWSTDTWDEEPKDGQGYRPNGTYYGAGQDHGGAFRGCHMRTDWDLGDGSSMTISITDPESGSNDFSCEPSNHSKYYCEIGSDSVLHGPILLLYYRIKSS